MSIRINKGYIITDSIHVGDTEFVLGVNMHESNQFATWECKDGKEYNWGHYTDNPLKAVRNLCERAMNELRLLENNVDRNSSDNVYNLFATVKYGNNIAVVEFPTWELGSILGSIGITVSPNQIYLKGNSDIEVSLLPSENKMIEALQHLFKDDASLHMVNEASRAVFHSDFRVYDRLNEELKAGRYHKLIDLMKDVRDHTKYLKGKERNNER